MIELRLTAEQAKVLEHVVERYLDVMRTVARYGSARRVSNELEQERRVLEEILRRLHDHLA